MKPDIGLKLFTEGSRTQSTDVGFHPNPLIDMDVEAVINFLNDMQKSAARRADQKLELTYEQKYLLKLCDIPNAPEKYFTQLGTSIIDALYSVHSRKNKQWDRKDRKLFHEVNFDLCSDCEES